MNVSPHQRGDPSTQSEGAGLKKRQQPCWQTGMGGLIRASYRPGRPAAHVSAIDRRCRLQGVCSSLQANCRALLSQTAPSSYPAGQPCGLWHALAAFTNLARQPASLPAVHTPPPYPLPLNDTTHPAFTAAHAAAALLPHHNSRRLPQPPGSSCVSGQCAATAGGAERAAAAHPAGAGPGGELL